MSKYFKYLENVVTKKIKLHEIETMALTKKCSSVVMRKIPKKLKDIGSFTLPIKFDDNYEVYSLSDLGANKNMIPILVLPTLDLGKSRSCSMVI